MAQSQSQRSARKRPAAEPAQAPKRTRTTTTAPSEASGSATAAARKKQKTASAPAPSSASSKDNAPKGRSAKKAMDMSRASGESASNSPSEEAEAGAQAALRAARAGFGGPSPELGGALSFFMRRAQMEGSDGSPSSGFHPMGLGPGSSGSQFSSLMRDLKSDDGTRQLVALTELAEQLSFSSEESLISFPMETFIPLIINILGNPGNGDETTGQVMLLSCRCLFNVVDILPPTARIIVGAGGLPVLCANLLNIEYIDVAELTVSIIELISEDQPLQVLKAGGLEAILTFLDFFQISVQRQAANAAALMLVPVLPTEIFDQYVKSALPTLAQLLQSSDPQVLQSICEGWRRVLDGCIAAHERPQSVTAAAARMAGGAGGITSPSSLMSRFAAQARMRFGNDGAKQDVDEDDDEEPSEEEDDEEEDEEELQRNAVPLAPPSPAATAAGPSVSAQIASALQEMVPGSVLGNLMLLLGNSMSAPSPQSAAVLTEVLYIISVLANYSDQFAEEVLQQDICGLLRQMLLSMDLVGAGVGSTSQANSGITRVLSTVASIMPSIQLGETGCACEERRLALLRQHPEFLDAFCEGFLPMLLDIYQASMDPSVQSLCTSLLLTFTLACQERPHLLRQHLDFKQLASFVASLLLAERSRSVSAACLLIIEQLLTHHAKTCTHHITRQGVLHAIQRISERQESPQAAEAASTGCCLRMLSKRVADRIIAAHFASEDSAETALLARLRQLAQDLDASPELALAGLRDLLLAEEGLTAFEVTCSGVATSLRNFLLPEGCEDHCLYTERLRLFLEHFVTPAEGALVQLVRLCVSALQRIQQQPLMLFPTQASPAMALPRHLIGSSTASTASDARGRRGDFLMGMGTSRSSGSRGQASNANSPLLSVLRLLGKPVKVRMGPHGQSASTTSSLPTFRSLLHMPLPGSSSNASAAPAEGSGQNDSASNAASARPQLGDSVDPTPPPAPASAVPASSSSPAARLRNYLASKVSRKRGMPSMGVGFRGESKASGAASSASQGHKEDSGARGSAAGTAGESSKSGRHGRDREKDREQQYMADALEAVLLVEPFAQVSALEDYIWERHGPGRSGASTARGAPTTEAGSGGAGAEPAARVRLNVKQPPPGQSKGTARARDGAGSTERPGPPQSPPAVPLDAPLRAPDDAAPESSPRSAQGGVAVLPPERRKQTVRIFYGGQPLSPKTSIVQVLVSSARKSVSAPSAGTGGRRQRSHRRAPGSRFLALVEDSSGSDAESPTAGRREQHASSSRQFFCGLIWGMVHHMTYELIADPSSSSSARSKSPGGGDVTADATAEEAEDSRQDLMVAATDFDCLVHRHARVQSAVAGIQSSSSSTGSKESPSAEEPSSEELCSNSRDETFTIMLHLLSAFYHISLYNRSCIQEPSHGSTDNEHFHCNSLTSAVLRQLSDPLAVCTGSIPSWCPKLAGACRFLLPFSVRRILHQSCHLGLGRALLHVQQRAVAQNAQSQEAHRRLEGELGVVSVPRQKVRIARQRLLESAIKVLNLYGANSALLEVEYMGEVGTGSGPTLEFYAQIAEALRNSEPRLFRKGTPGGMLFPEPYDPEWLKSDAAQPVLERFRLLGQMVAKCILDSRLVDVQIHPAFWRSVLGKVPLSQQSLRNVDPELFSSLSNLRSMDSAKLGELCIDFTLPGHAQLELKPGGSEITISSENIEEYVQRIAEVSLVEAVAPQVKAFRTAFKELLPLETCQMWSEQELASIVVGASYTDDSHWNMQHLASHIKAQHGYTAESRVFRDLLTFLSELPPENRRDFLTFTTGAPTLPIGGFGGLKPPLTVVKKESPPAPLTPDNFMPSVMTCANYLKLPEYTSAEILKQKLNMAMREGQSAFLLS